MKSTDNSQAQPVLALTDQAFSDDAHENLNVLLGRSIRYQVTRRSNVLLEVERKAGVTQLPGDLTTEDVQLWQAACLVRSEPSTEQLVTILKARVLDVHAVTLQLYRPALSFRNSTQTPSDNISHQSCCCEPMLQIPKSFPRLACTGSPLGSKGDGRDAPTPQGKAPSTNSTIDDCTVISATLNVSITTDAPTRYVLCRTVNVRCRPQA